MASVSMQAVRQCSVLRRAVSRASFYSTYTSGRSIYSTEPSEAGFVDYEAERKNFRLSVPEYYNFATDVIDKWASKEQMGLRDSPYPAFWWVGDNPKDEVKWTFQELSRYSRRAANVLRESCRLLPGERALIITPRVPEWWIINIAAIRAGIILITGTTQLTPQDIRYRIRCSGAKSILVFGSVTEKVDSIISECDELKSKVVIRENKDKPAGSSWLRFDDLMNVVSSDHEAVRTKSDDPMTIFFTSGTTGYPKMTEHTQVSYGLGHFITARYFLDLTERSVQWNLSDTGWAKCAWSSFFAPWIVGSCVFVHQFSVFDPKTILQVLGDYPVTTLCSAALAYRTMIHENLSSFTFKNRVHSVTGGETLSADASEAWYDGTGLIVRQAYGQSETVLMSSTPRCIPNKPGSMGKPPPGMDLTVINEDCEETAPGEEGDIALRVRPHRPVGLFTRYVNDPEKTASVFKGDYYLPGDRAYKDEDGYLWFTGRSDDIIISSGYRIGPVEVENAVTEHPAVVECAVVSSPDDKRGEVVKAFIVLTKGYQDVDYQGLTKDIQDHVKRTTAPYKYPRKIEFVDRLPKTVSDKTRRVELREKEWREHKQ